MNIFLISTSKRINKSRCFLFTRTQSFTGPQSSVVFSDDLLYWWPLPSPPPSPPFWKHPCFIGLSEFPLVSSVLGFFACDTLTVSLNHLQSREKENWDQTYQYFIGVPIIKIYLLYLSIKMLMFWLYFNVNLTWWNAIIMKLWNNSVVLSELVSSFLV